MILFWYQTKDLRKKIINKLKKTKYYQKKRDKKKTGKKKKDPDKGIPFLKLANILCFSLGET